ncbi:MAG TPA: tRNA lysidine(34) synthetase TilS [Lacipirellulaceae bacterium]|nr:tRNA lysidine(34) synthetase TilS [Lacipirellulaceae bacterium]
MECQKLKGPNRSSSTDENAASRRNERLVDSGTGEQFDAASATEELEQLLVDNWPVEEWRDTNVVLAVSGGADSVSLLRAMAALKKSHGGRGSLFVAHLDHAMRGQDSITDAAWVEALCGRLEVPIEVGDADVPQLAAAQGDGWEAAARKARYDFLRKTAERLGARFVATGHTANDQVETVLHRILRGTGLAGVAGIPRSRQLSECVTVVRPLLSVHRRDVLSYLEQIGQDYRDDVTNCDQRYTRNRLRHGLLPILREQFNPEVDTALLRLAQQADEAQQALEHIAAELVQSCVAVEFGSERAGARHESRRASRVRIECESLKTQPEIIVREVFKAAWRQAGWSEQAMGFREWQLLASLARSTDAESDANLPANVRVRREGHQIMLESDSLP